MKNSWKTYAAIACYVLGILGWVYFGAWMILTKPVKGLFLAYAAGSLSIGKVVIAIIQGFVHLTIGGFVWCIGYMLSNRIRRNE